MDRQEYERKKKAYLAMKRRNRKIRRIVAWVAVILIAVCLFLVIKSFFGDSNGGGSGETPSGSGSLTPGGKKPKGTDTPSPSPSPSPTPTPSPTPNVVSMVAVGDNLYDWYMLEDGYNRENKTFDFSHNYDYISQYVRMADFAVVNQETPLGGDEGYVGDDWEQKYFGSRTIWGSYHGYASFNTPDEVGHQLVKAGFNIITMATNHSSDHGYKAVQNSVLFWRNNYPDVTLLGIHDSDADQKKITVVEKYGIKIALLNYTYGLNKGSATNEAPYSIDVLEEARVRNDIARAKDMADFVVVFPHWGIEYEMNSLDEKQRRFTKIFLECGVDAVVGAHPHICQKMEWLTGEDGHRMVVYYSLGNFISIFKQSECNLEGMAYLEFYKEGDKKEVREGTIIPLVNHWEYCNTPIGTGVNNGKNFRVYALQDYSEELAKQHGCRQYGKGSSFTYAYMQKLATQLWGDNIKVVDWNDINGIKLR